mmetsp:Transcript_21457/g.56033  ORF Transcript_21457/g.56033 Transcript_21457/m.56033 type:complete len:379 (+) Transcript_21457:64-1200(+)
MWLRDDCRRDNGAGQRSAGAVRGRICIHWNGGAAGRRGVNIIRRGERARVHASVDDAAALIRADVGAADAEAIVDALDGCLHRRDAVLHRPRRARDVEIGSDGRGSRRVALVDLRQHGRGEGPALGPRLRAVARAAVVGGDGGGVISGLASARPAALRRIRLPRVLEHALDQGHRHLADHALERKLQARVVTRNLVVQVVLRPVDRGRLDFIVDGGDGRRVRGRRARPELRAALLRQGVEEVAFGGVVRRRLVLALERPVVVGHARVPEFYVAIALAFVQVVDNLHPEALVDDALLDELFLHLGWQRPGRRVLDERVGVVDLRAPIGLVDGVPGVACHGSGARSGEAFERRGYNIFAVAAAAVDGYRTVEVADGWCLF